MLKLAERLSSERRSATPWRSISKGLMAVTASGTSRMLCSRRVAVTCTTARRLSSSAAGVEAAGGAASSTVVAVFCASASCASAGACIRLNTAAEAPASKTHLGCRFSFKSKSSPRPIFVDKIIG
jgi:hypothetical protein